ncbi:hypothetical protein [Streptomyces sp. MJM8645]|uniref:hypothetical protein n=1 Tax=Streptomycetaceae TaxID=2062 RepID=UPI00133199DA|nr:hypothetical protein [Streptomyces sp. MJM8645]
MTTTTPTTAVTVTAAEPKPAQAPDTAPLTLGLTVIETTVYALDVPLDEVPIELIEFCDDEQHDLSDEQHTLAGWLNDYPELWHDHLDPAKHTQTTENPEVVDVDVRDWPTSG